MSERPQKKNNISAGRVIKGFFGFIGRILSTMIMVGIITGCIVASVLTVYVLQMVGADNEINLEEATLGYTSIMYYYDKDGNEHELQRMYNTDNNRVPVSLSEIPKHTQEALISIEDKRFRDHQGVDWRRTAGAFVGQYLPIAGTTSGGGSTITQQLIKNITNDKEVRVDRKVREIFRAIDLEKRYTKDQILEAYLNTVPFGSGTYGIQAAAYTYFGKEAKQLTLAESAAIVGITQYPTKYNPFLNPANNKERQEWVLYQMLDQGRITQAEYDKAIKEKLSFKKAEYEQENTEVWSYFVDYVVNQVIEDLMAKKNYTRNAATKQFYEGGYRIYTTVDMEIQSWLEEVYKNTDMFPAVYNETYPQSECVITDINGKILGLVGGIGEKEASRTLSRATDSKRQPGSSIKPIASYALAFDSNALTWSTIIEDSPIQDPNNPSKLWPNNYYSGFAGPITVDRAINNSVNTVAVKVMKNIVTPERAFDFLKNSLNFHSLVEQMVQADGRRLSDVGLAPMAIGALTNGVTPLEMTGGYQIFANGGNFTTPYAYSKVLDANGKVVLEADTLPYRVIDEDTAVLMNKLLQRVTAAGTGVDAAMPNLMPTAGKTGTSEYDIDQWFIGVTPYYVCQVWLGYDIPVEMKVNQYTGVREAVRNTIGYGRYPPPILWKTIMQPLSEKQEYKEFMESDDVISRSYCTITGNLAGPGCPVGTGWYKKSRIPPTCSGNHAGTGSSSGSSSDRRDNNDDDDDGAPVQVTPDDAGIGLDD